MESGFFYPFNDPKTFCDDARREVGLPYDLKKLEGVEPDDRGSLIHFNSTYLDMIDRWHVIRGGVITLILALIAGPFALIAGGFGVWISVVDIFSSGEGIPLWLIAVETILSFGVLIFGTAFIYYRLRHEFFTYTHYPIRFNRKTRMVHVFRHNGPGGVLSIPWGDAFFHIGTGTQRKEFLDLRGHLMDGDRVVETFAVGDFYDDRYAIRQLWKFIVVYMEEGPQAIQNDIGVGLSPSGSWANSAIMAHNYCVTLFLPLPLIKWIPIAFCTVLRRLIMVSCKEPVWPKEIEAASVIAPDDPYRWPEPKYTGEFAKDPKVWAALKARAERYRKRRMP